MVFKIAFQTSATIWQIFSGVTEKKYETLEKSHAAQNQL